MSVSCQCGLHFRGVGQRMKLSSLIFPRALASFVLSNSLTASQASTLMRAKIDQFPDFPQREAQPLHLPDEAKTLRTSCFASHILLSGPREPNWGRTNCQVRLAPVAWARSIAGQSARISMVLASDAWKEGSMRPYRCRQSRRNEPVGERGKDAVQDERKLCGSFSGFGAQ